MESLDIIKTMIFFHSMMKLIRNMHFLMFLKKYFEEKKLDFNFDFYNKKQNPQAIEKPTRDKPLIYNLFGNVEFEGSLVLTYDDLFNYLISIFGKQELHKDLRMELRTARMILFLGFKFEK